MKFDVVLGKAYWAQGFFNVGVRFERYFGKHDSRIEIQLGSGGKRVAAYVNRTANTNHTPRVMGSAIVRDWFQRNSKLGGSVSVEICAPDRIRLTT